MVVRDKEESVDTKSIYQKLINRRVLVLGSAGALLLAGGGYAMTTNTAKTTSNIVSTRLMKSRKGSDFEGKRAILSDERVIAEAAEAHENITSEWVESSSVNALAEIDYQRNIGLDAYVIQWGDTLAVIAEAIGISADDLADKNQLSSDSTLYAGDLLDGVLYQSNDTDQASNDIMDNISTDVGNRSDVTLGDSKPSATPVDQSKGDDTDVQDADDDTPDADVTDTDTPDVVDDAPWGVQPASDEDVVEVDDVFVGVDPYTTPIQIPTANDELEVHVMTESSVISYQDIKFDVEYIKDDTLDEGIEIVEQNGLNGTTLNQWDEITYTNGVTETSDTVPTIINEPVTKIVRKGTKLAGESLYTKSQELREIRTEFKTEYVYDKTLEPGDRKQVTYGTDGIRYELFDVTRDEYDAFVEELLVDDAFSGEYEGYMYEPVDVIHEVIRVGTKTVDADGLPVHDDVKEVTKMVDPDFPEQEISIQAGVDFRLTEETVINLKDGQRYVFHDVKPDKVERPYLEYYLDGELVGTALDEDRLYEYDEAVPGTIGALSRIVFIGRSSK